MKRCHVCNRTYSDETFSFCLSDGALLSASIDSPESKNNAKNDEKITVVFERNVKITSNKSAEKQSVYLGSVKFTGAVADEILVGMKSANKGLIIQIYKAQEIGFGGRVKGMFKFINAGKGDYSHHLKVFENKNVEAEELIEHIIRNETGGKKNIHIFNCNMLKIGKSII